MAGAAVHSDVETYAWQGFAVLRGVLHPAELRALQEETAAVPLDLRPVEGTLPWEQPGFRF